MKKIIKILLGFTILTSFCLVPNTRVDEEYFSIAKEKLKLYNPPKKEYVVIIDYRKNILSKRLYLLDMVNNKILLTCRVSHAKKSGLFYAKNFSNTPQSKKSCTGAFLTKNTRPGRYGYSMVIKGLDKNINNNVEKRVIIVHPTTALWSEGCFATTSYNNKTIIDYTKNGSLIYVIK